MQESEKKRIPFKRILMIVLTYLIPIINIFFLLSYYENADRIVVGICSVLASTSAASACTIKGIKEETVKLSIAQSFALVFALTAFISCLSFEVLDGKMLFGKGIVIAFTVLANVITIYMFCIADKEFSQIIDNAGVSEEEKKEAKEMKKRADSVSRKSSTSAVMKVTKKGGNKNE